MRKVVEIKMKAFDICIYHMYSFLRWRHIYRWVWLYMLNYTPLFCIYNLHIYVYAY